MPLLRVTDALKPCLLSNDDGGRDKPRGRCVGIRASTPGGVRCMRVSDLKHVSVQHHLSVPSLQGRVFRPSLAGWSAVCSIRFLEPELGSRNLSGQGLIPSTRRVG